MITGYELAAAYFIAIAILGTPVCIILARRERNHRD